MSSLVKLLKQKNNLFRPAVLNVQNNYLDEHCIIVDENDKPLRSESKRFCHSAKTLTLHRAFSVFLFTENHEMILQKRAVQKLTFPSVWTNACCSHPLWNEDEMCTDENNVGIRRAARRKLNHELGIQSVDIDQMKVMGRFLYKAMHDDNWGEHEIDYVIILRGCNVKQIRPNPEEVEAVAIVSSMEELTEILKSSEASFSPWFNLIVRNNFLQTWWHELDRLDGLKDFKTIHRLN
ncbi:isopentenyl-diphosphate delta-isomerase, type 1 family protein [Brugia malayi]|uniref:isopentenyl-diphosphate Delta-isomerase n=1 Tax=Brugia malayi TaxID=6279 RepID=A0A0H5RZH3_BRUMA|nr:isopentenyl-diphosphate delta-isomerase, type 1 family protein [Brugia malayi]CRZ21900.1 BMA-IDI-1 [Brugia malayi]VIO90837.1 isopentenyl-diphosphate delta-isomerase, type 1 family protein [Brugia malayi]